MTRILIPTYPQDIHAAEVALALADLGHEAVLWYGADFPTRQCATIHLEPDAVGWEVRGEEIDVGPVPSKEEPFDVVWFRRLYGPELPEGSIHPDDRAMATRENEAFLRGLWRTVGRGAFQVNPMSSREASNSKAVQLQEARAAGLTVPPTLVSNDPERIRAFLERHGEVIYKPFFPAQWGEAEQPDDALAILVTTPITASDLPEDDLLRLTAGIFQKAVPKAHELRVTWMGRHHVTAELHSQESDLTRVDWRIGQGHLRMTSGTLPEEVERGCQRLMDRLGLVFGCFDFIVTPEGRHVFLEVNPMGQFLWKEVALPELTLLNDFCAFLLSGRGDFQGPERPAQLRHEDYQDPAEVLMEEAKQRHVEAAPLFVYPEDQQPGETSS